MPKAPKPVVLPQLALGGTGGPIVKRRRCGTCLGCIATDCGKCGSCLDMPKFGGPGTKRQSCRNRRCLDMIEPVKGYALPAPSQMPSTQQEVTPQPMQLQPPVSLQSPLPPPPPQNEASLRQEPSQLRQSQPHLQDIAQLNDAELAVTAADARPTLRQRQQPCTTPVIPQRARLAGRSSEPALTPDKSVNLRENEDLASDGGGVCATVPDGIDSVITVDCEEMQVETLADLQEQSELEEMQVETIASIPDNTEQMAVTSRAANEAVASGTASPHSPPSYDSANSTIQGPTAALDMPMQAAAFGEEPAGCSMSASALSTAVLPVAARPLRPNEAPSAQRAVVSRPPSFEQPVVALPASSRPSPDEELARLRREVARIEREQACTSRPPLVSLAPAAQTQTENTSDSALQPRACVTGSAVSASATMRSTSPSSSASHERRDAQASGAATATWVPTQAQATQPEPQALVVATDAADRATDGPTVLHGVAVPTPAPPQSKQRKPRAVGDIEDVPKGLKRFSVRPRWCEHA